MRISATGNVGIGTTGPQALLHVNNTAAASASGQKVLQLSAVVDAVTAGSGPYLGFYTQGSGGAEVGRFASAGEGANKQALSFYTYNSGLAERVRINAAGNVGIGTVSPWANLDVRSSDATPPVVNIYSTNALNAADAVTGILALGTNATGNPVTVGSVNGIIELSHESSYGALSFSTRSSGTVAEKVRITSGGYLGIGTTAPSQAFEVNGGARLNTTASKPTCNSAARGTFWVTQGSTGVKDAVEICAKDAAEAYAWRVLY